MNWKLDRFGVGGPGFMGWTPGQAWESLNARSLARLAPAEPNPPGVLRGSATHVVDW